MRTPLFLAFLILAITARSQQHHYTNAERKAQYLANARALPRLYAAKDFDSIAYYVQLRWQPGPIPPDLFCQSILLSIQRHIFYLTDFPDLGSISWPATEELNLYAHDLLSLQTTAELSDHGPRGYYTVTDQQFFLVMSRWAADLLCNEKLDSVETFMCRVFSGSIRYPQQYLADNTFPSGEAFDSYSHIPVAPPKVGGVLTIGTGAWFPTGHLSLLGVHPALNYSLGARTWRNEWDIDAAVRFVNSPNPYTILRDGALMSRTFYEGGNLSFDYSHYLRHVPRGEFGPCGGLGLDFIDFAQDSEHAGFSQTEIVCFDINVGVRYNFYFSRSGFIGFIARYHFLSYSNPGGSPFDGNAATIDVIVGNARQTRH